MTFLVRDKITSISCLQKPTICHIKSHSEQCGNIQFYIKEKELRCALHSMYITIVSSYEGVSVFVLQLPVDILFSLFQGNVHVAVQAGKHPCHPQHTTTDAIIDLFPKHKIHCISHCTILYNTLSTAGNQRFPAGMQEINDFLHCTV